MCVSMLSLSDFRRNLMRVLLQCHQDGLDSLKAENLALSGIVDKVLLLCSVVELASKDRY